MTPVAVRGRGTTSTYNCFPATGLYFKSKVLASVGRDSTETTRLHFFFTGEEKRKSECEKGLEPEAPQPTYSRFTSGRITIDRCRLPLLVGCIGTDCVWGIASCTCLWMAIPFVQWVVPMPVRVSSSRSLLSQQTWTNDVPGWMFDGTNTSFSALEDLCAISCCAIPASTSCICVADRPCPKRFRSDTTFVLP